MTPELAKWVIGMLGTCTVAIVAAVVWLSVLAFRIGQKYGAVEQKLEKFDQATERLERATDELRAIPLHAQRIGQLEHHVARVVSDVRELLVGPRRPRSNPSFSNEE